MVQRLPATGTTVSNAVSCGATRRMPSVPGSLRLRRTKSQRRQSGHSGVARGSHVQSYQRGPFAPSPALNRHHPSASNAARIVLTCCCRPRQHILSPSRPRHGRGGGPPTTAVASGCPHRHSPPSPRRPGRPGQKCAAASAAQAAAWSQSSAPRECRALAARFVVCFFGEVECTIKHDMALGAGLVKNTPIWQFSTRPAVPLYWRATPAECWPFLRKPVSSMTSTAWGLPRCSTTYGRKSSRRASASHWARPNRCCSHRASHRHSLRPIASHFCAPRG